MYGFLSQDAKRQKILGGYKYKTLSPQGLTSFKNIEKEKIRNPFPELPLEKGLDVSYAPLEQSQEKLNPYGYKLDTELSTRENKVFYNPYSNKMIFSVAGTNPLSMRDIGTDAYLAFLGRAGLKNTNRYREAESVLEKARKKYEKSKRILIAHSLGLATINSLKNPNEELKGFATGSGIFPQQKKGETYRTYYDLLSLTSKDQIIPPYLPPKKGNLRSSQKVDYVGGLYPSHSYHQYQSNYGHF